MSESAAAEKGRGRKNKFDWFDIFHKEYYNTPKE